MTTEDMLLQTLIDRVKIATHDAKMHLFNTKTVWLNEVKEHSDRFYIDNNGQLLWLGCYVCTYNISDYEEIFNQWKELHNKQ